MKKRQVKAPVIEEEEKILGDNDTEEVINDVDVISKIITKLFFLYADPRFHQTVGIGQHQP